MNYHGANRNDAIFLGGLAIGTIVGLAFALASGAAAGGRGPILVLAGGAVGVTLAAVALKAPSDTHLGRGVAIAAAIGGVAAAGALVASSDGVRAFAGALLTGAMATFLVVGSRRIVLRSS